MTNIRINLNRFVEVILTEYGAERFNAYFEEFCIPFKRRNAGDLLYTSLWEIMNIFGDCMYNGNPHTPFVNNELSFTQ